MTRTIYHVHGGVQRNYGDFALTLGMRRALQNASHHKLHFVDIDYKDPTPISKNLIDCINRTGDMILVGGGGMIMPGDGFETRSGWQFNIGINDIHKLRGPLVVYGIGYNEFPFTPSTLTDIGKHLLATNVKSSSFSVRDKGTKSVLERIGLKNLHTITDPAINCPKANIPLPGLSPENLAIGLNWAGDRLDKRFKRPQDIENIIHNICCSLLEVLGLLDPKGKVVYIPHVSKFDLDHADLFKEHLGDHFYYLPEKIPYMYPETPAMTPVLNGVYDRMDVTLGMRGHSNILSYSNGTPFVAFGDHIKNSFFAESVHAKVIDSSCNNLTETLYISATDEVFLKRLQKSLAKAKAANFEYDKKIVGLLK